MSGQAVRTELFPEGDTKRRILDAAEVLFVAHGADDMSLRAVTSSAGLNIAAVNYHFGNKDNLIESLLARRLDPLNDERARMLAECERRWPDRQLTVDHVLAAMFVPALRLAGAGGEETLRGAQFFGRAYSDPSPIVTAFVKHRYEAVTVRFLEAFARTLPHLPRADLRLRLAVVLKSVAGLIAGPEMPDLLAAFVRNGMGPEQSERRFLGSLGSLMSGALRAPLRADNTAFNEIFALPEASPAEARSESNREGSP
ncbi:TetR family transcriptional regulator [Acetobacteraceae bacterium KSS8]|uniref:TetR family transcriptional regulator n=1 Tax=Endosaccharibacter trunci TaxID=2812733 RepID=A0ABT1W6W5_9PROT|nr:TetR family transcriptional regulator [Acetobacteraceae bacterium KSS8]